MGHPKISLYWLHETPHGCMVEIFDYPIGKLHYQAERLEHFISSNFDERLDQKLGSPTADFHGYCIPAPDRPIPQHAERTDVVAA